MSDPTPHQARILVDAMDALITMHSDYDYGFEDIITMCNIGIKYAKIAEGVEEKPPERNNIDVSKSEMTPLGR